MIVNKCDICGTISEVWWEIDKIEIKECKNICPECTRKIENFIKTMIESKSN